MIPQNPVAHQRPPSVWRASSGVMPSAASGRSRSSISRAPAGRALPPSYPNSRAVRSAALRVGPAATSRPSTRTIQPAIDVGSFISLSMVAREHRRRPGVSTTASELVRSTRTIPDQVPVSGEGFGTACAQASWGKERATRRRIREDGTGSRGRGVRGRTVERLVLGPKAVPIRRQVEQAHASRFRTPPGRRPAEVRTERQERSQSRPGSPETKRFFQDPFSGESAPHRSGQVPWRRLREPARHVRLVASIVLAEPLLEPRLLHSREVEPVEKEEDQHPTRERP